MSTLNDLKYRELHQHGFSGTLDDMLASFYKGAGVNGEREWLSNILGKNDSLNDLRYEYLLSQGFTGSHNDMLLASLEANQYFNTFTPLSLFSAGEQGVWYDPSDFSTMFQDAAGTTPVTAVEQPVGLILDKSKGLVLGPELVTNGDFSSGTTGWTAGTGGTAVTLSVVNQRLRLTKTSTAAFGSAVQQITGLDAAKRYKFSCNGYVGTAEVRVLLGGAMEMGTVYNGAQSASDIAPVVYVTGVTSFWITVLAYGGNATYAEFDNISVRELPGNHATQTTSTSRPVLQQDGNGKYYLRFDGVDDWLITPTITPGTDKAQVFAGVRKLINYVGSEFGILLEFSTNVDSGANSGVFRMIANGSSGFNVGYNFDSRGTVQAAANLSFAQSFAPQTLVSSGLGDISGDSVILRVNGAQVASSTADQGTGNYLAYPLYIGRRGGTTLPFNGHLYGLIVRFGANLPAATIASTETWLNGKTGAY